MVNEISRQMKAHIEVVRSVEEQLAEAITASVEMLVDALRNGKKVLLMGNGGSAADAQHFAAEMVGRFLMERKALPAIALTTDTSILTAVGNDYGFNEIFKRQVEALAEPGDVVFGISTSGKSVNVKRAIDAGKDIGAKTLGLLGCDGGDIASVVDLHLTVPSSETPRIQEAHLVIIHIICDLVEKGLFCLESD
ncbi:D-sedoheptulose 7-phosphate isomerase [Deltaproteobacteria bacterium IMCC39524]|nr:D-sedoheptulose 7-phosphate isomerase [Deltaproteobacteria bacterium IMCC39524]